MNATASPDAMIAAERPRKLRGALGWYALYQGSDHFAVIRTLFFHDHVRLYPFAQITAITCTRTRGYLIWALILLGLAVIGLAAAATVLNMPGEENQVIGGLLLGFAAVAFVTFAVHLALGPTCRLHLHTAVQREHIRCVTRWRAAQRLQARMRMAVEAAQGSALSPAQVELLAEPTGGPGQAAGRGPVSAGEAAYSTPAPPGHTTYHHYYFVLASLAGASGLLGLVVVNWMKDIVDGLFGLGMLGFACFALAHQHTHRIPKGLGRVAIALLATYMLGAFVVMVGVIIYSAISGQTLTMLTTLDYMPLLAGEGTLGAIVLVLALWGLVLVHRGPRSSATRSSAPSSVDAPREGTAEGDADPQHAGDRMPERRE